MDKKKIRRIIASVGDYVDPRRLLTTIAFVSLPAFAFWLITHDKSNSILLATLMAIIIYTWKNWQLKDLTCEQIILQIRPLVIFECNGCHIQNVGKGIAKHIWIEKIPIDCFKEYLDIKKTKAKFVVFDRVGCLEDKGLPRSLNFYLWDDNKEKVNESDVHRKISEIFNSNANSLRELKMNILYYDLKDNLYKTCMANRNGVFQVIDIK